jgi:hypothetical protein
MPTVLSNNPFVFFIIGRFGDPTITQRSEAVFGEFEVVVVYSGFDTRLAVTGEDLHCVDDLERLMRRGFVDPSWRMIERRVRWGTRLDIIRAVTCSEGTISRGSFPQFFFSSTTPLE